MLLDLNLCFFFSIIECAYVTLEWDTCFRAVAGFPRILLFPDLGVGLGVRVTRLFSEEKSTGCRGVLSVLGGPINLLMAFEKNNVHDTCGRISPMLIFLLSDAFFTVLLSFMMSDLINLQ